jgi:hypothetical protein
MPTNANTANSVDHTFASNSGYYSAVCRGGTQSITITSALTPLTLGANNFTIEGFFNLANSPTIGPFHIIDWRPSGTIGGAYPSVYINASGFLTYYANGAERINSPKRIEPYRWYHFAVERQSNVTRLYINGVANGTTYSDSTNYLSGTSRPILTTNAFSVNTGSFTGYLSNIRVVNGTAVYTANFSVPTLALTAVTNTRLIICASNTIVDLTNTSTFTNAGITITQDNPFGINSVYTSVQQNNYTLIVDTQDANAYINLLPSNQPETVSAGNTLFYKSQNTQLENRIIITNDNVVRYPVISTGNTVGDVVVSRVVQVQPKQYWS